jgi:hypothetical protein
MADRTVTVKLEADVAGFVADIGGKAVAAVKALDLAAKNANTSIGKVGADAKVGKVGATAAAAGRDLDGLGSKANSAAAKISKIGDGAQAAGSKISTAASTAGAEVDKAGKKIDQSMAAAGEKVKRTSAKAGADSGKSFGASLKKWLTGDGTSIFTELGKNSGRGFIGALTGALKTPVIGPILLAALLAAVSIAAPAAGAVAGAGLVAGFGAGIAGLGLLFAAQSDAVGKVWSGMLTRMGEDMKLLSKPFESTLIQIAGSFQRTVDKFNPELAAAFSNMAGPVSAFVDQVVGPEGLGRLAPAVGPITDAFNGVLGALGPAMQTLLGDLAASMTALAESVSKNPAALADMVTGLSGIITMTLGFVQTLNEINSGFSSLTGGVSLVTVLFKSLEVVIGILLAPFQALGWAITGVNLLLGKTGSDAASAGQSMSDAASKTAALAQGLDGTGTAAQHAGPHVLTVAEQIQKTKQAAADAKAALQSYIATLFQMPNILLSVRDSQRGVQAAIDDATKSIKDNGRTLDIHTPKGRANQAALDAITVAANKQSESYIHANASQKAMTAGAAEARTAFVQSAVQMGMNRAAAKAMADQYIKTPTKVATDFTNNADGKPKTDASTYAGILRGTLPAVNTIITNNGAGTPKTNAERYRELLGLVPRAVPTVVTNTAPVAQTKVDQYRTVLGLVPQSKSTSISTPGATSSQGQVSGLLGLLGALPQSKSTNIYTNMIQTTTYKTVGVKAPGLPQADGGYYPGGVPSYADGKLPNQAMVAPGKGSGLVQWAEGSTGGEAFIPLAPSKRDRSEMILGQVANTFGMQLVRSFADGGFLPGGNLVDVAYLLRQLGIGFNPSAGVNYGSTLSAQNQANSQVGGARTASNTAAAAEAAAKADVARLQRAITLQQRYVAALRQGNASQAKIKAEQKDTIALQDQLYQSKQRLTGATNASNRADATLKLRVDAATKATDAHKAAVQRLIEQQKAAVDMAAQIASGLTSAANIGDLFQQSLTGKGLLADLQSQGAQLATFKAQIDRLRKQGLSEDLIQQLVGKGATQGGQAAQAILEGGAGLVAALNKAQKALEAQANLIGAGSATKKFGQAIAGARALGGPTEPNKAYLVGENGPEVLRMGARGGWVDPNRYVTGGNSGGVTTVIHQHHQTNEFHGVSMAEADLIAQRANAKAELMAKGY